MDGGGKSGAWTKEGSRARYNVIKKQVTQKEEEVKRKIERERQEEEKRRKEAEKRENVIDIDVMGGGANE